MGYFRYYDDITSAARKINFAYSNGRSSDGKKIGIYQAEVHHLSHA